MKHQPCYGKETRTQLQRPYLIGLRILRNYTEFTDSNLLTAFVCCLSLLPRFRSWWPLFRISITLELLRGGDLTRLAPLTFSLQLTPLTPGNHLDIRLVVQKVCIRVHERVNQVVNVLVEYSSKGIRQSVCFRHFCALQCISDKWSLKYKQHISVRKCTKHNRLCV